MPATYMLTTVHPAPGHELEALSSVREVKAMIAKHDPAVLVWRTTVGGTHSGSLHVSMGWDSAAEMGRATEALVEDPEYLDFMTRQQGRLTRAQNNSTVAGFDIRGLPSSRMPLSGTVPRAALMVMYPSTPEAVAVIGEYRDYLEAKGITWFGRAWTIGVSGAPSVLASYTLLPSPSALGAEMDAQFDDPKWRAIADKARPLAIGRRWLTEVL